VVIAGAWQLLAVLLVQASSSHRRLASANEGTLHALLMLPS
jgi:hypothetical protein